MLRINEKCFANTTVVIVLVVIVWCIVVTEAVAREPNGGDILNKMPSLQVPFVENQGQIKDENVKYYARTFGGTVFVTKDGNLVYSFPKFKKGKRTEGWVIKETFIGSCILTVQGESSSINSVNYFKGKDPSKWITNVSTYNLVNLGEVYEGIELKLKPYEKNIEKLFYVKPNGNLRSIKVKIEGAKSIRVNEEEELEVETGVGVVKFTKPVAYQQENGKRKYVEVAYTVKGDEYGFQVGSYDRTKELLIDPLLGSTFVGGSSSEMGIEIEVDDSGNVYISGVTMSSDFPTAPGAFDKNYNGGSTDIFITKLSSTGDIIYSTFIGGSSNDYDFDDWLEAYVFGMSVDSSGSVYVTGETFSSDFPTTAGAFDRTFDGYTDAFVTKLNSSGDALVYSTFLGGSYDDAGAGIVVDSLGNAYITGETGSWDFPTTSGAFDRGHNGSTDIFVLKLDPAGTNIEFSTFIGGGTWDEACDIVLDSSGNIYVVGVGGSSDFPTTPNAFDRTFNGEHDIYVSKFDATGGNLLASTFLGGSDEEWSSRIGIDSVGNIFLSGDTGSTDFPMTPGAYDTKLDGDWDAFIAKLDSNLSTLLASTSIGGSEEEGAFSLSIDDSGNVYVAGRTSSTDYPTTAGAYDNSFNGGEFDVFVGKFNNSLSSLLASTLIGGSSDEYAIDLALDSSGNVFITGGTYSPDYPVVTDASDDSHNGGMDAFVSSLDSNLSVVIAYDVSDLEGTWHFHGLTSGDSRQWIGWAYGTQSTDATGNCTVTSITRSDWSPDLPLDTTMAISSSGVVTIPGTDFHGTMNSQRDMIIGVMTDGGGGYDLVIFTKAGGTFTTGDLEGTWNMHALGSGNNLGGWAYGTFTGDTTGSFRGSYVTSRGHAESPIVTLNINSNGIINALNDIGVTAPTFHGVMSNNKDIIVCTGTGGDDSYQLRVFVKMGGTFTTSDLCGTSYIHGLVSGDDTAWQGWYHVTSLADSSGNFNWVAGSYLNSSGDTDQTFSGTMSITTDGVVGMVDRTDFHGVMSIGKDMVVGTLNDGGGGYDLVIALKRAGGSAPTPPAPPLPGPSADPLAEALDTALSFTTGGDADWFAQTTTTRYDGDAAQSGDISRNQESWMQTTVSGTGTVKFYWKVSSEEDFDFLEFYIDGSLQEKTSGLEVDWERQTYTISTSGSHTLEWRYMKDGSSDYGSDCGWVDKVEW